jgi:MFS family permease
VLPTYIEERHKEFIDESMVAIIIAFTEVGCLLLSPVVGILLDKFGRKNIALCGFVSLVSPIIILFM